MTFRISQLFFVAAFFAFVSGPTVAAKETLNKCDFVIPAKAGIQESQ